MKREIESTNYDRYDLAIVECLREGRKRFVELADRLVKDEKKMARATLASHLKKLEDDDVVVRVPGRLRIADHEENVFYYELVETRLESEIPKAVGVLRRKYLRDPTIDEIARFVGEIPDAVSKVVYRLAQDLNWMPPTEDLIEIKRRELAYLLELAAMKKFKPELKRVDILYEDLYALGFRSRKEWHMTDFSEKAMNYAKDFPEMVPGVKEQSGGEFILEWGEEARKIIGLPVETTRFSDRYSLEVYFFEQKRIKRDELVEAVKELTSTLRSTTYMPFLRGRIDLLERRKKEE